MANIIGRVSDLLQMESLDLNLSEVCTGNLTGNLLLGGILLYAGLNFF